MPMPDTVRRRAPSGVLTRMATGVVALVLGLATTACTGGDDQRSDGSTGHTRSATSPTQSSPSGSAQASGTASSNGLAALVDADPLVAAVAVVPERAAVVAFTDLDRVKQRLGYAGLTGEDPTADRFGFWEQARADGAMFTGPRLYDASSAMALDYGWTAEDVSWEVDYALTENGCLRSMLCDTARGYVLGLRPDLDWSVVTNSLQRNGFEPEGKDPATFESDDPKAPFAVVHLIPELHAIAGGNAIGVQRLAEVVGGAPPFSVRIASTLDRLGTVESLHVDTGCVDLPEALGPDATEAEITAFLRTNPIGSLAAPVSTTVAIKDSRRATIDVELESAATPEDLALRTAAIRSWPGLQTGTPFAQVADLTAAHDGDHETYSLAVSSMPQLRSMVLTDEAPWALCPYAEDR